MIYIRLRNRQESGFRNYFFTHERSASQYSLLFSRRKTLTFWSNSIRQLTGLLPWIERLRFGQNRRERNAEPDLCRVRASAGRDFCLEEQRRAFLLQRLLCGG